MEQVEIERAYRIVGSLEKTARKFEEQVVPALSDTLNRWRKRTLIGDAIAAVLLIGAFFGITIQLGHWQGMQLNAGWWDTLTATPMSMYFSALVAYLLWLAVHYGVRGIAAKSLIGATERLGQKLGIRGSLSNAFLANTKPWHSIFSRNPVGWGRRNRRRIQQVLEDADRYVQDLNDRFTNPSGNPSLETGTQPAEPILESESFGGVQPARASTAATD